MRRQLHTPRIYNLGDLCFVRARAQEQAAPACDPRRVRGPGLVARRGFRPPAAAAAAAHTEPRGAAAPAAATPAAVSTVEVFEASFGKGVRGKRARLSHEGYVLRDARVRRVALFCSERRRCVFEETTTMEALQGDEWQVGPFVAVIGDPISKEELDRALERPTHRPKVDRSGTIRTAALTPDTATVGWRLLSQMGWEGAIDREPIALRHRTSRSGLGHQEKQKR